MDGLELARIFYAPPPASPASQRPREAPARPALYDSLFGAPALETARMEAFSEGYALAKEKPGLARDLRAGIDAAARDARRRAEVRP